MSTHGIHAYAHVYLHVCACSVYRHACLHVHGYTSICVGIVFMYVCLFACLSVCLSDSQGTSDIPSW